MTTKLTIDQITSMLQNEIEQKKYGEHEKFATERELMERFSISRMSARQVLNTLVSKQVLYRIKGKGVFVNKKIIQRSHYIYSFTELMRERGMVPSSKLLELKRVIPPEIARLNLGMSEGEYCFFVKRLRYANEEPFAYETLYTPISLIPDLESYDLEKDSFYRILEEECHKEFSYNKEIISAEETEKEIAQYLYGQDSGIALKVLDILYDVNHCALEYAETWYHAQKYSYVSISVKR